MTTAVGTKKMTLVQAVTDGLRTMMKEHDNVLVLGEDVAQNGGVFRATDGLLEEFGDQRIIDTPLAESGIIGTSIGLAMNGFRPVAEMQFLGFIYPAFNQIMTHATRIRARTLGAFTVPMVIRAPYGAGVRAPEIHSDSVEALFAHMPGMKVVVPSNAYDAKGMLIASIEDPDPVLFLEPMRVYRSTKMDVPEGKYTVELGKGSILREGSDVTVLTYGSLTEQCVKAAEAASEKGYSVEVIDLRSLYPLDKELIAASVQKTGRAVIVHEAPQTGGLCDTLISLINDTSFFYMKAPVEKVTGHDTPVPMFALEDHYLPTSERIQAAIVSVMDC
ncbi:pyruvate dehydrogenase subunit E1-beta [Fictibacillus macauensis ZFHKF-1]|uniref:Pyruvate dehydrogenase subunit E1-beta n=1 Tax=Fictibacillus macauensis ZFHKF-1 TaxID=1196324 RepID=I8UFX7_9BACL|nr:alpha-ketoacid dehydrogenase subunit beta [Fictibacillus macauensis]EIT85805.1 pyruvate dehydrogenase subunit E1-beta [Fictibacillus macauensis ZFHKF-1]